MEPIHDLLDNVWDVCLLHSVKQRYRITTLKHLISVDYIIIQAELEPNSKLQQYTLSLH